MKKALMILAALALSSTLALAALTLDAAKQQGLVGEQPDGLVGAVAPSAEVSALVSATNAERLERYKAIAAKNGTDAAKVQALAGQKLIDQTPPGEYVMGAGGWVKK
jgi:uncharacterized protein YdbL (DUF1318 family)